MEPLSIPRWSNAADLRPGRGLVVRTSPAETIFELPVNILRDLATMQRPTVVLRYTDDGELWARLMLAEEAHV